MISKTIGFRGLANIFRHTHMMGCQLSQTTWLLLAPAGGHPGDAEAPGAAEDKGLVPGRGRRVADGFNGLMDQFG